MKSTVEQIRARFDNDVERFSNLGVRPSNDPGWPSPVFLLLEFSE